MKLKTCTYRYVPVRDGGWGEGLGGQLCGGNIFSLGTEIYVYGKYKTSQYNQANHLPLNLKYQTWMNFLRQYLHLPRIGMAWPNFATAVIKLRTL